MNENFCQHCYQSLPWYSENTDKLLAVFEYAPPIDKLIYQYKFQQKIIYSRLFVELLLNKIQTEYQTEELPSCIIPVPLHNKRVHERGYDQAHLLGKQLAKKLHIPLVDNLIYRNKYTKAQARLSRLERKQNMSRAFRLKLKSKPKLKTDLMRVALIDDVITTGQTMTQMKACLHQAGITEIHTWCIAKTSLS